MSKIDAEEAAREVRMPDLSKITIDELIQMLREERDDLPTDELIRILREKPDGLHAAAIIEALQQRWLGLLRGSFASLGFAAHLDITQDTWVRLQARLRLKKRRRFIARESHECSTASTAKAPWRH